MWWTTLIQLLMEIFKLVQASKDPGASVAQLHDAASSLNKAKTEQDEIDALKKWQLALSNRS